MVVVWPYLPYERQCWMQREDESEESKTRSRLANWGSVITTTINWWLSRDGERRQLSLDFLCLCTSCEWGTDCSCSRLSLQGPLHIHQPWKRMPPSRAKGRFVDSRKEDRAGMVTAHYKRFGFLGSEFPSGNTVHCVQVSSGSHCIIPWAQGNGTVTLTLWPWLLLWAINCPLSSTHEAVSFTSIHETGRPDRSLTIREQSPALHNSWYWNIIVTAGMKRREWRGKKFKWVLAVREEQISDLK